MRSITNAIRRLTNYFPLSSTYPAAFTTFVLYQQFVFEQTPETVRSPINIAAIPLTDSDAPVNSISSVRFRNSFLLERSAMHRSAVVASVSTDSGNKRLRPWLHVK